MNKKTKAALKIALLVTFAFSASNVQAAQKTKVQSKNTKELRVCPDAWIINRIPTPWNSTSESKEYFIIDGTRKDLVEFDLKWIGKHCPVNNPIEVF